MPNWCHNRYAVQGQMGALIQFKNWVEGLYPTPRYHLAMEHSKKFFILGASGHFTLTQHIHALQGTQFDYLMSNVLGEPTMANQAYTEWVTMLANPNFALTDENSRRISNLFYSASAHFITWDDLTEDQQHMAEAIMSTQAYDWYNLPFNNPKPFDELFNSEPDVPEMGLPGDFYHVMSPPLTALINGYNGRLTGKSRLDLSGSSLNAYNMNVHRYGTKWTRFLDTEVEIHNETQASMDVQTAWSPPSEEFDAQLVEKFGLDRLNHRYIEEGCAFAGYRDIEREDGRVVIAEDECDVLVMGWLEEDKLKYKDDEALWENCEQIVVSPDYVKDIYDSTKKLSGLIGAMACIELEKKE